MLLFIPTFLEIAQFNIQLNFVSNLYYCTRISTKVWSGYAVKKSLEVQSDPG